MLITGVILKINSAIIVCNTETYIYAFVYIYLHTYIPTYLHTYIVYINTVVNTGIMRIGRSSAQSPAPSRPAPRPEQLDPSVVSCYV